MLHGRAAGDVVRRRGAGGGEPIPAERGPRAGRPARRDGATADGRVDFALATLPVAAAYGVLVLGADLDASWTVALSDGVRLMPRGGVSSAFGVALDGDGGAGAVVGYNAGIGLLQRTSPTTAVRLDYTYRRLVIDQERLPLSSLTIGFVWMH